MSRQRKRQLTMTRKRGTIPRGIWNALVDWVAESQIVSVVGGERRVTPEGTVLDVRQRSEKRAQAQFRVHQLTDDDKTLQCNAGVLTYTELFSNSGAIAAWGMATLTVTKSQQIPAANTTYGVWIQCQYQSGNSNITPRTDTEGAKLESDRITAPAIVWDTTYTEAADLGGFVAAATPSSAAVFLATVVTDADGVATSISQDLFGPIDTPMPTYLINFPP